MQDDKDGGAANDNQGNGAAQAPAAEPHPALRTLARLLARQAARDLVDQAANDNTGTGCEDGRD